MIYFLKKCSYFLICVFTRWYKFYLFFDNKLVTGTFCFEVRFPRKNPDNYHIIFSTNLKKTDVRFWAYKKDIIGTWWKHEYKKMKLTAPSKVILPHLVTNLHALVSINTLVTRLVFISVSTKDVDMYYQVLSMKYSLGSSATDLNYRLLS